MKNNFIFSERQQKALDFAINIIKLSPVFPYIAAVYLYGSCARGEEKPDSDVDLFLELKPSFSTRKDLRIPLRLLKSEVTTDDFRDPEVDLKIVIGNDWKTSDMLYYKKVREEGVLLCL